MAKKQRASHLDEEEPSTLAPKHQEQEHEHADATSSPPSSSSEDEETESGEEEEETNNEQNQPTFSSQPPSKNTLHPNPNPNSSSSSSEETESESDSESQPPPKLKSINSNPIDQISKSNPQPKSGTKRSADDNTNHAKKKKTASAEKEEKEVEEDKKKSVAFQRVFNDDDEVAILQGVIDFTASTGNCPFKYHTAFYEFVKNSIHVEITLDQLRDKIRRMKVKFFDKTKNGKVATFSKPVEQKIFDLGQKIWGDLVKNKGEVEEKVKGNGKRSVKESAAKKTAATKKLVMEFDSPLVVSKETAKVEKGESGDEKENPCASLFMDELIRFNKSVGVSGLNNGEMKRELELIEESKRRELERKWKKLQIAETELFVKRAELVKDSASLILHSLMLSSSH